MKLENKIILKGVSKKQQPKYTRMSLPNSRSRLWKQDKFWEKLRNLIPHKHKTEGWNQKKSEKKQIKRPYKPR